MYKISICGKANTGKNTLGKLLFNELYNSKFDYTKGPCEHFSGVKFMAFADPIKEMIRIAYPEIPRKWLYGPSKFRNQVIPGAFKDGIPMTVRQYLIDLGNEFGRARKSDIWLANFDNRLNKHKKKAISIVVVTDVRFRNEFDHLSKLDFYQIRLLRNSDTKINDISETNQDGISDNEFDYVVNNNGTLDDLKSEVSKIVLQLKH
jgi:hypothetical protein